MAIVLRQCTKSVKRGRQSVVECVLSENASCSMKPPLANHFLASGASSLAQLPPKVRPERNSARSKPTGILISSAVILFLVPCCYGLLSCPRCLAADSD
jgi:hypothetical protein